MDLSVKTGKTLGIIGESGCGKSVTAHSILNTVQAPGKVVGGSVLYRAKDGSETNLMDQPQNSPFMRSIRGREVSMIFQEPMTSMSPIFTIGQQMTEAYRVHQGRPTRALKKEAHDRAMDIAVKKEIAELRRLKLPVIVSRNGKPFDINPDTNPDAPPWED